MHNMICLFLCGYYIYTLLFRALQYELSYLLEVNMDVYELTAHWKQTFASGAVSIASLPSISFLSLSAPSFSSSNAASPWPSDIARILYVSQAIMSLVGHIPWCKAVNPSMSAIFKGLRFSIKSLIIGTLPAAAARCKGNWPRLSRKRVDAL